MPAVSVVIPHYRAVGTLGATLSSVLSQTLGDIEVVIVDDGSDEDARRAIEAMAGADARVISLYQKNNGVSAARNAGIMRTRAPLIAFMDADDIWTSSHLALHVRRFETDPALGMSFSTARFIGADGTVIGHARPQLVNLGPEHLLTTNPTTTTSSWVVRRNVFDAVGLFDVSLRHAEDQEFLVRAALASVKIEGTPDSSVDYRTAMRGLAADLARMRAGFEQMLTSVCARAPQLVERHGAVARAREDRFLARQALRLSLPRATARHYAVSALRHAPSLAFREPRQTFGTCLAALLPQRLTRSGL